MISCVILEVGGGYYDITVMIEDTELLRRYAEDDAEDAFAELVRRRIGLVYGVALRRTRGDAQGAQDATQKVFADLARKAAALSRRPVLAGWLYRSAQFAAADIMRAERRRHARQQEAIRMQEIERQAAEPNWDEIRPVLDEHLTQMDERDRDAVLLRFFDGRPFAEIGARIRLSENAARMRVERALEKLRIMLERRGVFSTTSALGLAQRMNAIGVRTIIYTDIGTDGMLTGPNFAAQEAALKAGKFNVIASGGVSRREDVSRLTELAKRHANLNGVIVGKALYEKRVELGDLLRIAATR